MVTLSTEDNVNLEKQLSNGFERYVYWNNYQTIPAKVINQGTNIYELLRRLFVLAYVIDTGADNNETGIKNNREYFLPRGKIENYNILIDGRNFYYQTINDLIKQYDEVRKISIGQDHDYTTRCL